MMTAGIWFVSYLRYLLSTLKAQQKIIFELEWRNCPTEKVVAKRVRGQNYECSGPPTNCTVDVVFAQDQQTKEGERR
jgi:hypothetical protein